MKIYTKTGDLGVTGTFDGKRVSKDSLQVEALGGLDELNCVIGVLNSIIKERELRNRLRKVQKDLFLIGAEVSVFDKGTYKRKGLGEKDVGGLEKSIDELSSKLPALKFFILPGGSLQASVAHLARSVARRCERRLVSLSRREEINPVILKYLNRLSDFLFLLARYLNASAGIADEPWRKG